jgi:hypothetical protein
MQDDKVDPFIEANPLIKALADAEEQLQWGCDVQQMLPALTRLRELAPDHPRVPVLERKLAMLRERSAARTQRSIREQVNVYLPVFI